MEEWQSETRIARDYSNKAVEKIMRKDQGRWTTSSMAAGHVPISFISG